MKQKLQTLIVLALSFAALTATAQKADKKKKQPQTLTFNRLILTPGQKILIENSTKSVTSTEMMGQAMETPAEVSMTRRVEVKEVKPGNEADSKKDNGASYIVGSVVTRMALVTNAMGQDINYDSDKKDDSSATAKMMEGNVNVPVELEINAEGKIITVKKDSLATTNENTETMAALMSSMGIGGDATNVNDEFVHLMPLNAKEGTTWADSIIMEGIKIHRTYAVKTVEGNTATIFLTGTQEVNKKTENMGMEMQMTMTSKISGEIAADMRTGIVLKKSITTEGAGSMEIMGQAIPMTTKTESSSTIKIL